MKRTEINSLNEIVSFGKFAMKSCDKVRSFIANHGPAIDEVGSPFYRNSRGDRKDPVAIICPNWPMRFGPCIDDEGERIAKVRKQMCREIFGEFPSAFIYAKFEELLAELQVAHDESFAMILPVQVEEMAAAQEEFGFRIRKIKARYKSQIDAANLALKG